MKTDTPRTWPIATLETSQFAFIGLPQRLGSGQLPTRETYDLFLPLEAVVGEDWLAQILAVLLPRTVAWAWWTPSRTKGLRQLALRAMPAVVSLRSLDHVVGRRWFWEGMTLAIVPPARTDAQNLVLDWAGIDTEHTPEFILAAPPSFETWDSRAISAWCRNPSAWKNPDSVATLPAERIIVLFDGDVYCALPTDRAPAVLQAVRDLAARWGLRVIPGPVELAWPTPPNS
jgi:hypothetical protein